MHENIQLIGMGCC